MLQIMSAASPGMTQRSPLLGRVLPPHRFSPARINKAYCLMRLNCFISFAGLGMQCLSVKKGLVETLNTLTPLQYG